MDDKRNPELERIYTIWGMVVIIWSLYRAYMKWPETVDELVVKPLVFVLPVFIYVLFKEKRLLSTIGLTLGKFYRDLYIGIGFGMLFALEGLVANMAKHGKFSFAPLIPVSGPDLLTALVLAIATGFTEELLIRGFFYTRLKEQYASEIKAMIVSSAMYFVLLVPAVFLLSKLSGNTLMIFVFTNLIISFANTMIFNETKTLTVPILVHAFWNMAVTLYL